MRDWLELGCVPSDEPCESVPYSDGGAKARKECRALIRQLRRMFGPEPSGAGLFIRSNSHDFGTYVEVVCYYDDTNETAVDYAFHCEGGYPEHWDKEAREELGL